jgi:hypothetical protein
MEPLETTPIPWVQGVAGSNPAAPTNRFSDLAAFGCPKNFHVTNQHLFFGGF